MAVQSEATSVEEARQDNKERTGAAGSDALPEWVEGSRSYWDTLQAAMAKLTEAVKEAIHASLKE
jgi:hypothetical protein